MREKVYVHIMKTPEFKVALQWKQEVVNIIHTLCNYPFFFHSIFSYRVLMNGTQLTSYLLSFYRV